jgi:hypothetical protein
MQTKLAIDLGEGEIVVETNLWVITLWERKFKRKASDLANGVGIEDLAFMAHELCKQHKIVVPAMLDDFIKKLVKLEPVEETTVVPTEPALSAEG